MISMWEEESDEVGLLNNNTSSAILTDQPVSLAELNHNNSFSERGLSDNVQDGSQTENGQCRPTLYVVMAAIMASLGGLLFGYDIGIISGAVLLLREQFLLSCWQQALTVSSLLMGGVVGSLFGGFLIDYCGRRLTIIINSVIFLLGALVLTIAPSYPILILGRLVLGFAVSVSAIGECIYISEIAHPKRRGFLVSLNELGITLGLLVAYLVNYLFINVENGWRFMFGLSMVPAAIQGAGMLFLPKSPRFLMIKKQEAQAEEVLKKLRGNSSVKEEITNIRISLTTEKNNSILSLFSKGDNMRGRMLIGGGLVFFQQLTGQPNVLYYAPMIFESIGFASHSASTLATVGLGVVKVIATVIALLCVDRWGRRKFLLFGTALMGISILSLGILLQVKHSDMLPPACADVNYTNFVDHSGTYAITTDGSPVHSLTLISAADTDISNITLQTSTSIYSNTTDENVPKFMSFATKSVALVSLMTYVAAYGVSYGPVTWLVLSEIYPSTIKGRAISIATVFNWGINLIVSLTFLEVIYAFGISGTFITYSVVCLLSFIFIFLIVPETKNKSLEQISSELSKRSVFGLVKHYCAACCNVGNHGSPLNLLGKYHMVHQDTAMVAT